jgi:two-component system chemotaxis sensor kinase CheA
LTASQEGSNIVIRIKDNGRGLDIESIKNKAVELNKVSETEVHNLTDQQLYNFIFDPGFSTAKKVSDVSGRGVGMDVVHTNIEKLNGTVEINSAQGKGTTFTIKLPLTLAIIQGLLVESDNEVYVLPMSSVEETVRLKSDDIYYVNKKPVFRLRDEVIPVININGVLKGSERGFVITEKPYIVIVSLGTKKLGIIIDKFIGQEEVVVKPLGQYMCKTEGVAGATILGTGHVRLIVDLIGLFNLTRKLV